jgi:hypothetical protein
LRSRESLGSGGSVLAKRLDLPLTDMSLRDESRLLTDLREVAKSGVDDPALLIDLDGLLALASPSHDPDLVGTVQRCEHLSSLLLEVLDELTELESSAKPLASDLPSRREVINGLFMLTKEWKGKNITTRRRELAGGEPSDNETSTFRRTIEEPLYRLVLSHLIRRVGSLVSRKPVTPVDDVEVTGAIAAVVGNALDAAILINAEAESSFECDDPESLERFLRMHRSAYHLYDVLPVSSSVRQISSVQRGDGGDTWVIMQSSIESLISSLDSPLSRRELSTCLATFHNGQGPFRDYLEDTERGKGIFERWCKWLGGNHHPYIRSTTEFVVLCMESAHQLLEVTHVTTNDRFALELLQQQLIAKLVDPVSRWVPY